MNDKYSLGYAIGNSFQELKEEKEKLIKSNERLKNKNKKQQQEIERLNNIINELDNDIYSLYEDICNSDDTYSYRIPMEDIINRLYEMNNKLKELKEEK